ncbi:MAG TPA: universal stress protein [Solirubrobacteraceae bacterium]|nr:universal stress protein [Solirubrobacteraceae bacterium]
MLENVLVGVDGGSRGRDAVALAQRLMGAGGKLTLAHVHPGRLRPLHAISPSLIAQERESSHALLERELAATGVTAELISVEALSPGRGLHEQAQERGADLLVVGSSARGALGRAMLGDDTLAALNGAPCAVAIAAIGLAERTSPFATIGVAYDGSPESGAALAAARELASRSGASVRALQVVSIPSVAYTGIVPPAIGEDVETMLHEAQARISSLGGVEGRAVYGLAGEELASFGDEVDLLLAGSRSYGPVKRLVLGSTSAYLARHARSSLLVLRRPHEG